VPADIADGRFAGGDDVIVRVSASAAAAASSPRRRRGFLWAGGWWRRRWWAVLQRIARRRRRSRPGRRAHVPAAGGWPSPAARLLRPGPTRPGRGCRQDSSLFQSTRRRRQPL